jgi:outer membrane protein
MPFTFELECAAAPGISKEFSSRMKRTLAIVLTLASGFALTAAAQTPSAPDAVAAPAGPAKIAVIAFQVAVAQTNEGQRSFADLQRKYQPKQTQLKALNDEIDGLTKQLQTQGASLSDAERAARAKTIDDKKKQLERSAEDAQNDMQNEMQELYGALASKVYDVLNDYVKKNGYTLVLDFSQQQNPVLYAADSTNITKAIIDAYNVKSGVPAPTNPATGATPVPSAPRPAAPKPTTPQ